ncbi:DUF6078 family protein [Kaistella faecalis]|uniref:DUF6078 family protein n=1 Tax=Kaistella faecalis TaxID=2852098 RepID=UPI001C43E70B|nr:DUF6078 family protein [Chryseobacterium faecale]UFK98618.1 DUF6078 family protein [Chryseobacterium faecale]
MLTYESFPSHFHHCMLSECPHSAVCLRFRAFTLAPQQITTFSLLNPSALKSQDLLKCRWLYKAEPQLYTRGLSSVLERLPHATLATIRTELILLMGHSTYYRHLRNERWLDPETQHHIQEIFRKHGVEEFLVYGETRFAV